MRSVRDVRERYTTTDCPITEDVLTWVLAENLQACPFCDHPQRRSLELRLSRDEMTVAFLEAKMNWPPMTTYDHIENHMEYNAEEAALVENIRSETISTLNSAESIVQRIMGWLDELEEQKGEDGGISSDFVTDASKLVNQANNALRMVGQLKKEIGVDSQLLLAQSRVDSIMGILVDTLNDHPDLLNQLEFRLASLKAPPVLDADYTIEEEGDYGKS